MSSKNDVTGDSLRTKIGTKKEREQYADNFDSIFRPSLDKLKDLKVTDKDDAYWKKYFEGKDDDK